MPSREIVIQPPLAGVNQRMGYQRQPPFSTKSSSNYWPFDVDSGRAVTATRPGQANFTAPGSTVEMLAPLNGNLTGKPDQSMVACSAGSIFWYDGDIWRAATGGAASSADTGRAVYGRSFLQQTFIMDEGNPPIVFDYELETATSMSARAGSAPTDCRMAEVWQGALWLAGDSDQPEILFGSRTGDPFDWDFGVSDDDPGGAWWTSGVNAGLLTGPITAIFGQTADTMIVSTFDGIFAMRGHPRRQGIFSRISGNLFVLGQGAWCRAPGDVLYMLTPNGLAALDPSPNAVVTLVSRDKIPDKLIGLTFDYEDPRVSMAYSTRWNVVYIAVREASPTYFLYDLNAGGFHEMSFSGNAPYVMAEYEPAITADTCGVLWGMS